MKDIKFIKDKIKHVFDLVSTLNMPVATALEIEQIGAKAIEEIFEVYLSEVLSESPISRVKVKTLCVEMREALTMMKDMEEETQNTLGMTDGIAKDNVEVLVASLSEALSEALAESPISRVKVESIAKDLEIAKEWAKVRARRHERY